MTFSNFFRNSAVETHGRASLPVQTHGRASLPVQTHGRASLASAHSPVQTHGRASLSGRTSLAKSFASFKSLLSLLALWLILFAFGAPPSASAQITWTAGQTYIFNNEVINDNITLVGTGVVTVEVYNLVTINGVISGPSTCDLVKTGSGSVVLANNNTYMGNTNVWFGLLYVGNNSTTGAIAGNIHLQYNSSQIYFNRSNDYTYSGNISGAGEVIKQNSNSLYLTGNNTHTGGTTIQEGTLYIGNNSETGSISGNIENISTLSFYRSNDYTYSGVISGMGNVYKKGNGNLYFTGNNTYIGYTFIQEGTLSIGNASTQGAIAGNIDNEALLIFNSPSNNSYNYNGVISGPGEVRKIGAGTTYLTGVNYYYTGITQIFAGLLVVNSIESSSEVILNNDAKLEFMTGTDKKIKALRSNSATTEVILGSRTLTIGTSGDNDGGGIFNGVISGGGGSIVKRGSGTLTLTGNNTYQGATTIHEGSIAIGSNTTTGSIQSSSIINHASLRFARSNDYTYSGVISGVGQIIKEGAATLFLTGNNTYLGTTSILEGTLSIGNNTTAGAIAGNIYNNAALIFNRSNDYTYSGVISGTGTVTKNGAGALYLTGNNTCSGTTTISAGTLYIGNNTTTGEIAGNINNTSTLSFYRSDDYTYIGAIWGAGNVIKQGTGTLFLTANNTYTGTTTISAGTISVGNNSTAGAIAGNIILNNNTTLQFARSNELIYNGVISGSGEVTNIGTGIIAFTGVNTYSGGTTISNGTLVIYMGGSITGNITNNANLMFNTNSEYTYSGVISGTGSVSKIGLQTLIFTGNNTYSGGTTINAGSLSVGNGGTTGAILASGNIENHGNIIFNRTINQSISGIISGTGSVTKLSGSELNFSGNNSYTGITTISEGSILISGANGNIQGNIVNNGLLRFMKSAFYTYSGVISGSGSVNNEASGTIIFSGNNTYSGTTNINAGSIYIGNNTASGAIAGNIVNNGTLIFARSNDYAYNGVISGTGNVFSSGDGILTLSGNSISTGTLVCDNGALDLQGNWAGYVTKHPDCVLSVTGNRTIGGNLIMVGGTTNFTLGTTPSRLSVTGALSISDTNTLNITGVGSASSYVLISAASGVSTTYFTTTGTSGTLSATATELTFTPTVGFIPVTDITDIPASARVAVPLTLTGTVVPVDATNQDIVWSVENAGTTGANITSGNILNTTDAGTVTIRATIINGTSVSTDYFKDVNITVRLHPSLGGGNGTSENPYLIITHTDLKDLADFVNTGNGYGNATNGAFYRVENDLDLASYASGSGWQPIGFFNTFFDMSLFRGHFNGNGKVVNNLTIDRPTQDNVGLFGYTSGSTITNLGIENVSVVGNASVGALVGYAGGTIQNCFSTGTVTGIDWNVGGLVGESHSSITNSYSTCDVSGDARVAGLVGYSQTLSAIENCYASGNITGNAGVAGVVGTTNGTPVRNCVAANPSITLLSDATNMYRIMSSGTGTTTNNYALETMILTANGVPITVTPDLNGREGADATLEQLQSRAFYNTVSNWSGIPWSINDPTGIWKIYDNEGFPFLRWQEKVDIDNCGGDGTEANPFLICSHQQLKSIANFVNEGNSTNGLFFRLQNDIDLTSYSSDFGWQPIGYHNNTTDFSYFEGIFDGNGHIITNLTINRSSEDNIGLFGYTNGATIKNLGIENVDIVGNDHVGVLVGNNAQSIIENCYAAGTIWGQNYIGGLIGANYNNSTVENCYAAGNIMGYDRVGVLVGFNNNSNISNCYTTGNAMGENYVGGLIGYNNNSNVFYCYARGNVTGNGIDIGGLVGSNQYSTVTYNVAANENIVGNINYNRIVGSDYAYAGNITYNYALETMLVNGNPVLDGSIYGLNGGDASYQQLLSRIFYNTASYWNGTTWDINDPSAIWKICNGERLPFFNWQDITCSDINHTIIATSDYNGMITPAGFVNILEGSEITFTFQPNAGSEIDEVFVDGTSSPEAVENGYHTFVNVTQDHTIHVTFIPAVVEVLSITISPKTITLQPNVIQQFTVVVETVGGADESVEWQVTGNESDDTYIDNYGWLMVGSAETAETLTVRVTSLFNGNFWDEATVTVQHVGIHDVQTHGRASQHVYPNPTTGVFFVRHCGLDPQSPQNKGMLKQVQHDAALEIFDITGRIVHRVPCTVNREPFTVDITHLPNGIYFIKIDNETIKIVKN